MAGRKGEMWPEMQTRGNDGGVIPVNPPLPKDHPGGGLPGPTPIGGTIPGRKPKRGPGAAFINGLSGR
jgi:hypothetical protein